MDPNTIPETSRWIKINGSLYRRILSDITGSDTILRMQQFDVKQYLSSYADELETNGDRVMEEVLRNRLSFDPRIIALDLNHAFGKTRVILRFCDEPHRKSIIAVPKHLINFWKKEAARVVSNPKSINIVTIDTLKYIVRSPFDYLIIDEFASYNLDRNYLDNMLNHVKFLILMNTEDRIPINCIRICGGSVPSTCTSISLRQMSSDVKPSKDVCIQSTRIYKHGKYKSPSMSNCLKYGDDYLDDDQININIHTIDPPTITEIREYGYRICRGNRVDPINIILWYHPTTPEKIKIDWKSHMQNIALGRFGAVEIITPKYL